jgi:transcriptional regulator with XRE-family HTH domain
MGINHDALAAMIGATVHDLQKFELGECRIDAKRFLIICRVLDVPASFFFDGITAARTNERRTYQNRLDPFFRLRRGQ